MRQGGAHLGLMKMTFNKNYIIKLDKTDHSF